MRDTRMDQINSEWTPGGSRSFAVEAEMIEARWRAADAKRGLLWDDDGTPHFVGVKKVSDSAENELDMARVCGTM